MKGTANTNISSYCSRTILPLMLHITPHHTHKPPARLKDIQASHLLILCRAVDFDSFFRVGEKKTGLYNSLVPKIDVEIRNDQSSE